MDPNRLSPQETPRETAPVNPVPSAPAISKKKGGSLTLLWGFIVVVLVLVFAFYGLLLWSLFGGSVSNPLFEVFGISASNLKLILIQFTNALFGTLCLLLLMGSLVNIFRLMLTSKDSPIRKSLVRGVTLWCFLFFISAGSFITLYILIDRAQAVSTTVTDQSMIVSNPPDLRNLQAPILVDFNLTERLTKELGSMDLVQSVVWDFNGDEKVDATRPDATYRYIDKGENNGVFMAKATVRYTNPATGKIESLETQREVVISDVGVLADITANTESGVSPLKVEFNGAGSSDPDGSIIRYEWDFDNDNQYDLIQEEPAIVEHTFSRIGEHVVKLRVTGTNNDYAVIEQIITVDGGRPTVEAKIASESGFEGEAPFEVVFDGKNSYVEEGVITKYEWLFEGEKSSVLGSTQKRVFREPGEYKVALTVENDLGQRHRSEQIVKVLDEVVKVNVVIETDPLSSDDGVLYGNVPFEVEFDASKSIMKSPVDWEWDFDDDGLPDEYGQKIEKVFREPGQYVVTLTMRDIKGRKASVFKRIVVNRSGVIAKISADKLSGTLPLDVHFDGSGSSSDKGQIINYIWEFPGKDPVDYGAQISYLFRQVGTFPVKLKVVNASGEASTSEIFISVRPPTLIADFKMLPKGGRAPLSVTFDPIDSQGVARDYHWDFGDGSTSRAFKPTHEYKDPGIYLVELRLVDKQGIVSRTSQRITVSD